MTKSGVKDSLPSPLRDASLGVPAFDGARRNVELGCHGTDAAELVENGGRYLCHEPHYNRTSKVRQSHYHVRAEYRTWANMDSASIIEALRRLGVSHDDISAAIGRDRTTATKLMNGRRNVQVREINALQELVAKYERVRGEAADPERGAYVEIEVLPTFAGMGGGGSGDGERRTSLVSAALVRDELRGSPADFLLIEVRGTSMEPKFFHGDQLLIDRRDRNPVQPGPFAVFDGDAFLIKNVERAPGRRGWYRLWSEAAGFSEHVIEETETSIMGRPVWFARRL